MLGFRDILDSPEQVRAEWHKAGIPAAIIEHYDRVLVYGHPAVLYPAEEYGRPMRSPRERASPATSATRRPDQMTCDASRCP